MLNTPTLKMVSLMADILSLVDHHIIDENLIDDFSDDDYDSPPSDHIDADVDVKEALRSSICLKSKLHRVMNHHHADPINRTTVRDETLIKNTRPNTLDLPIPTKKEKKPKKPEDVETAAMRRERNRLAAQRCRQRRRDRIDKLEKICDKLQNEGDKLQTEISDLQTEMNHLQKILNNHKCMAMSGHVKRESAFPYEAKYDTRILS